MTIKKFNYFKVIPFVKWTIDILLNTYMNIKQRLKNCNHNKKKNFNF